MAESVISEIAQFISSFWANSQQRLATILFYSKRIGICPASERINSDAWRRFWTIQRGLAFFQLLSEFTATSSNDSSLFKEDWNFSSFWANSQRRPATILDYSKRIDISPASEQIHSDVQRRFWTIQRVLAFLQLLSEFTATSSDVSDYSKSICIFPASERIYSDIQRWFWTI